MAVDFDPASSRDDEHAEPDPERPHPKGPHHAASLAFGPYRLDPVERTLKRDSVTLPLGDKAFDLLLAFAAAPGEILSKTDLAMRVWGRPFIEDGSLRVAVGGLRKLLGPTDGGSHYIANVVGRGYRLAPGVAVEAVPNGRSVVPAPARRRPGHVEGRLPPLLAPVFGRARDIARMAQIMQPGRCVTVVGPGGIGKTTLVVSCASIGAGDDEVCFVDLAPIRDTGHVIPSVATALGMGQASESSLDVVAHLGVRRLLLVLDNAEHLVTPVAMLVEDILAGAPHARILVTSREPLGVAGEWIYRLEPLGLPPADHGITAQEALAYDAVALFVDRVQATMVDFVLTDAKAPMVADICRKLDGVALPIRLAAGRVAAFGVKGVAGLLTDEFRVLAQKQGTMPSRHETLEAMFAWSYALLSPVEQSLLAQIAIFTHSFSLEAVTQVAVMPSGTGVQAVPVIGDLVAKSLVVFADDTDGARYRLLETVRVFALGHLDAGGMRPQIARRHAAYVIAQSLGYETALAEGQDNRAATIGRSILDDARAAIHWAIGEEDWALVSDLVHRVGGLVTQLGFAREVAGWLRQLLLVETDPAGQVSLMLRLGGALWLATPEDIATIEVYAAAYELARSLGDEEAQLRAAWSLILSTCSARRPPAAIRAAQMLIEAEAAHDPADRSPKLTQVLAGVSRHLLGDYARCEESIRWLIRHYPAEQRATGMGTYLYDPRHIGRPFLAWIEFFSGRLSDAAVTARCVISDSGDHVPSIVNNILRSAFPIAVDSGRWAEARFYIDMLEQYCSEHAAWRGWIGAMRDIVAIGCDRSPTALDRYEEFVTGGGTFAGFRRQTWYHLALIKGYLVLDRPDPARTLLNRVLNFVETAEGNWWAPELKTLSGHLEAGRDRPGAYARYQEAIALAHAEGSTLLELKAALGALRVADGTAQRVNAKRQSREAFRRLVARSPQAGRGENVRLLHHALCVCRSAQRRLQSKAGWSDRASATASV